VASAEQKLGYEGARHLLNRAGFGASDSEVRAFAALAREEAVDRLLAQARREASVAPPAFVNEPFEPYYRFARLAAPERMAALRRLRQQGVELRAWWLHEMRVTPSPLTERMTLFWHSHFATSQQKVRSGQLMYRQNVLLRREALGNFATLLHAVARDPAMLVYLDNAGSRRQAPNENFAREVMELFTMGEGRYGERDIKEAARAFTGWSLDRETGEFVFRRLFHDPGEKTVLGRTGRLDGTAVLDILLEQPGTAELVTAKLWREFVSPTPDASEVRRLAAVFRGARYEVKPLLRAMFTSEAFWHPDNRASLVKSPVDLVVGTMRTFGIQPMDFRPAAFACAGLGQNPMSPPNVKGWAGGEAWIDASTLLGRRQWIDRVFRGSDAMAAARESEAAMTTPSEGGAAREAVRLAMERGMASYAFEPDKFARSVETGLADRNERLSTLVLAMAPANPVPAGTDEATLIRALVNDPVYQLR
jgi:uncharacterized protein (DUF1800 family)